jgi:hypothetical protein
MCRLTVTARRWRIRGGESDRPSDTSCNAHLKLMEVLLIQRQGEDYPALMIAGRWVGTILHTSRRMVGCGVGTSKSTAPHAASDLRQRALQGLID